MAYRKQLKDKGGNVVYPDVGVLGTNNIADDAITTAKLADLAVTTDKIAAGAVTNGKIANGAVNVAKIENGAVSNAKIANDAITSNKINWATISSSGKIELGSICIQWGRTELSSLTWSDYWSSWRRTDAKTLTFPVAFSGAPYYTSVSTNANGTVFAQATQSGDADKLTFMLYKPNNVPPDPTTMKVSWIAIGPKS